MARSRHGTANWLLGDPQGTARDVAQFTAGSGGGTSILEHIVYNSFGRIAYRSTPGDQPRFTYTGQRLDRDTGLTYEGSGNSWYDAVDGVFAGRRTGLQWQCRQSLRVHGKRPEHEPDQHRL